MDLNKTVDRLGGNVDKIIDNEGAIVNAIGDIIGYLQTVEKRFAHLEGHIGQLSKRPAVIVKPNSKLFFLTACVASGYFGYKLADRRFREKIQEMAKQAKEAADRAFEEAREQFEPKDNNKQPGKSQADYIQETYETARPNNTTQN
jgi:hypothetical protein